MLFHGSQFGYALLRKRVYFSTFCRQDVLSCTLIIQPFSGRCHVFLGDRRRRGSPTFLTFFSGGFSFRKRIIIGITVLPCRFRFAEYGQEKAFTLRLMREKVIYGSRFAAQQISCDIPLFPNIYRQRFRPKFLLNPTDIFFVLFRVICTGTVYKNASGLQTRPNVRNNPPLPLPANFHILRTPFFNGHRIFTEHPFAGARHICQNNVKERRQSRKISRVVIRNHHIRMSPFRQVLRQNLRPVPDYLVGNQQTTFGQHTTSMGRFPSRSGTKVEHHHRLRDMLPEHLFHEHRRSLLHIITPCMKQRVECKSEPFVEVDSLRRPGRLNR